MACKRSLIRAQCDLNWQRLISSSLLCDVCVICRTSSACICARQDLTICSFMSMCSCYRHICTNISLGKQGKLGKMTFSFLTPHEVCSSQHYIVHTGHAHFVHCMWPETIHKVHVYMYVLSESSAFLESFASIWDKAFTWLLIHPPSSIKHGPKWYLSMCTGIWPFHTVAF